MAAPISPILPAPADAIRPASPGSSAGGDFQSVFQNVLNRVEQSQQSATTAADRFLSGDEEVHEAALAAERAELTFDLFLQARNKVVSAYQEIMRMQM